MSWLRTLGSTQLRVSSLALGTVKLGRNTAVTYPTSFQLPTHAEADELLQRAWDLGINLLDTAPAYGDSETRLGGLAATRQHDWLMCTKVGEEFDGKESRFDFSADHIRRSVERSLQRLQRDHLDIVLLHSDGNDLDILHHSGGLEQLRKLQQAGWIRAVGMSTKTLAGAIAAAKLCDVVMLTYNLEQQGEESALAAAARAGTGTLIKKALGSGHLLRDDRHSLRDILALPLNHPGTHSVVLGTVSPVHLEACVVSAKSLLSVAER